MKAKAGLPECVRSNDGFGVSVRIGVNRPLVIAMFH
jgi:hypothetical protein